MPHYLSGYSFYSSVGSSSGQGGSKHRQTAVTEAIDYIHLVSHLRSTHSPSSFIYPLSVLPQFVPRSVMYDVYPR